MDWFKKYFAVIYMLVYTSFILPLAQLQLKERIKLLLLLHDCSQDTMGSTYGKLAHVLSDNVTMTSRSHL